MSKDEVNKVLNTTVPSNEIIELQQMSKTVTDKQLKKQVDDYLYGLSIKSRITRLEDLKAKSYIVSKQVAQIEIDNIEPFLVDTIQTAYDNSMSQNVIRATENIIDLPDNLIADISVKGNERYVEIIDWRKQGVVDKLPINKKTGADRDYLEIADWQGKTKRIQLYKDEPISEFKELSTKYVKSTLQKDWKGSNYSKRIWKDTDKLAERISELLTAENLSGMSERDIQLALEKEFNVSAYCARRLVRTESNYVYNQANLESWKKFGYKKYQFVATVDFKTSEVCQKADRNVYFVANAKVGVNFPPLHPNCRSVATAYFKERAKGKRIMYDPIEKANFSINKDDKYEVWIDYLINKHGNKAVEAAKKDFK
ncbi:minor capsid protein, partial [Arthrospira platensis SPKY2]